MPADQPDVLDELESEAGRILDWRARYAEGLGYSEHDALEIALTRIDVHELEGLLSRGCARETAVAILA